MEVYFLSPVRPVRLVVPHMAAAGGGAIVNITSYVAQEPAARFPTSSAMRAGLHAWVKIVSQDLGPQNIRGNSVLPGFIDSIPQGPEVAEAAALKRFGQVGEIARTIAFLVSEGAGYITGEAIRVDGGITRSV